MKSIYDGSMPKLPTIPASVRAFFATCLLLCLGYRIYLLASLATSQEALQIYSVIIFYGLISDIITCTLVAIFIVLCQQVIVKYFSSLANKSLFITIGNIILTFMIVLLSVILLIHQHLYQSLYIGLNYTMLVAYLNQPSILLDYFKLAHISEFILLLSCVTLFFIFKKISQPHIKIILWVILPLYFLGIQYSASLIPKVYTNSFDRRSQILYGNPLSQIFLSFLDHFNQYNRAPVMISDAQQHSIQFVDPDFVTINKKLTQRTVVTAKNWNIVVFVLESVGSANLTSAIHQYMPFLASLRAQSVSLENNYSTGNISAFSQFSLLTGLYPNSNPCHYELQPHLTTPTLVNWLNKSYDAFFVTASNDLYAAISAIKTFPDYSNANIIDPQQKNRFARFLINEPTAYQFFWQRLNRARSPFLAFYWSSATHWPYNNYSKQKNLINPLDLYHSDLVLLDQEIKQTYELLRRKKLLDHTIFIVLGDHGELFGEHGNIMHGNTLYQEEIKTPLLIYAPSLFKPAHINELTNITDLLPTLLQTMGIDYGSQLQGESIFDTSRKRQYAFSYSDQDDIAAINQQNIKMIISFSKGSCVTYDLNKDPHENHPLPCHDKVQQAAILKYRHLQGLLLSC